MRNCAPLPDDRIKQRECLRTCVSYCETLYLSIEIKTFIGFCYSIRVHYCQIDWRTLRTDSETVAG